MLVKQDKRQRRHKRIRARIIGTAQVPRLCVFRSNQHIYAQLIDDQNGTTLAAVSDVGLKVKGKSRSESESALLQGKVAKAAEVGRTIAQVALGKKIEAVVFDRGGFQYHGRVKAAAEGAREAGLKF